ncbi:MAG: hypothetical protein H6Q53_1161 [Deltaproteobacteria bacterium]|nr:hypothetical protein [Deltaproteobacteria bacterium]
MSGRNSRLIRFTSCSAESELTADEANNSWHICITSHNLRDRSIILSLVKKYLFRILPLSERGLVCISRRVAEIISHLASSHHHVRGRITLTQCHLRAALHPFISSRKRNVATYRNTAHHVQGCNRFKNEIHNSRTNRQFPVFLDYFASRYPSLSHLLISRVDGSAPLARNWGGWMAPRDPGRICKSYSAR